MSELRDRVRRGMRFLDEHRPGWRRRVDLDTLNMASPRHCILGQLEGNYWEGVENLDLEDREVALGFNVDEGYDEYDLLAEQWREALIANGEWSEETLRADPDADPDALYPDV